MQNKISKIGSIKLNWVKGGYMWLLPTDECKATGSSLQLEGMVTVDVRKT